MRALRGDHQARLCRIQETPRPTPPGGCHIQIALANFSRPHAWLAKRGLITQKSNAHQYRIPDIVDVDNGALLFRLEHEVRSMRHPLYARPLVNRNARQSPRRYDAGHELQPWSLPARCRRAAPIITAEGCE